MRVVIAEDSVLLREGIVRLLEADGHEIVAAVGDADGLISQVEEHRPDLALSDVRMPPGFRDEGLRAVVEIRERQPDVALLVLSQYVEERYATRLLSGRTRALGYVLKDRVADVDEFLDAVRRVAEGSTVLDPEVVSQLLIRKQADPLERITAREREVLVLMAQGRSNAGIAAALVVSESTVAKHINGIFSKLDIPPADYDHRRVLAVLKFLEG
ncbi:response regulator [Streptomyces sp. NPDC007971]|uniref:response regulator transcription factor n=1 Tax=Streptomyces sp. NPDC007971 TaxID=3364799 RepID=UPI0036E7FB2D